MCMTALMILTCQKEALTYGIPKYKQIMNDQRHIIKIIISQKVFGRDLERYSLVLKYILIHKRA